MRRAKPTDKRLTSALIAVLLCGFVAGLFEVQQAKAVDISFYSSTSDGYIEKIAIMAAYSVAHDAATGTVYASDTSFLVGQHNAGGGAGYTIWRGFIIIDTSAIPDTATVTAATLSLYVSANYSNTDFNVTVQNGQPTYPHDPLQVGDYWSELYSGNGGQRNTSEISALGYWDIALTNMSWISQTGTTKLCLRSSKDINSDSPGSEESIRIYSKEQGEAYAPKLTVTYTFPSTPETGAYSYTFYGPFNEETGYAVSENVTVSVWSMDGGAFGQFEFNTTYSYNVSSKVQFFQFNFADGNVREYWVDPSESNTSTIYVFKCVGTNLTNYVINFLDTSGILSTYPYVTAKRYINGSLYTVEKRKVDAYNSINMNLLAGRTYQIQLGNAQTTYIFGDLLMTGITAVQLTLRGVDFPKETLLTQKYVRDYCYRNSSDIVVVYQDTKEATESVTIEIKRPDGTTTYNTTVVLSQNFTVTWSSADSTITYQVVVTAVHSSYGSMVWRFILPSDSAVASPPFGLEFLGNWVFNSSMLLPAFVILFAAGCFSALNAEVGALLMCIVAIILSYIGWLPIAAGSLVAATAFAILMALVAHKRRVIA